MTEPTSSRISEAILSGKMTGADGIRSCRKRAKISQETAAELCGVAVGSWREWEQGRHWPSSRALPMIAAVLGARLEEIYLGVQEDRTA